MIATITMSMPTSGMTLLGLSSIEMLGDRGFDLGNPERLA